MQRRDFLKSTVAVAVAAELGMGKAQARVPAHNCVGRHILGDDATRRDNGAFTNRDALQNDRVEADPCVIADLDWAYLYIRPVFLCMHPSLGVVNP